MRHPESGNSVVYPFIVRTLLAPAIDCTRILTQAFVVRATVRVVPGGVTCFCPEHPSFSACSSSVVGLAASFEELWDVAAVLEALHLGALWRFGDHLRRDQPME